MDLVDLAKLRGTFILGGSVVYAVSKMYFRSKYRNQIHDTDFIKGRIQSLEDEIERMERESHVNEFKVSQLQEWYGQNQNSIYENPDYLKIVIEEHNSIYEHFLINLKMYDISPLLVEDYVKKMEQFDRQVHKFDETWPILTS